MQFNVVSVNFSKLGKKYYFDTAHIDLQYGDKVIVETIRGLELGFVVENSKMIEESDLISALKPILRKASEKDYEQYLANQKDQPEILERCSQLIQKNKLEMKLLNCEYTLDRSKLIIYFNAEGRVDFRDLVKDLANQFRVRIELRQVGTRDGAKVLGGIGPCGLLTCCTTFLGEFETVSIKMAKNQNLSLNPTNISGLCGKLFCCINYEDGNYKEYRKSMPKLDSFVFTAAGRGKVVQVNFLTQTVKVEYPDRTAQLLPVTEVQFNKPASEENLDAGSEKELKSLEG
jgi:cell fate regulator YaaT (PSP1 superfamily)